ncbi:MAG: M28 family metallopeptidase, partial [Candidatus Hodarchaeota archaeon]
YPKLAFSLGFWLIFILYINIEGIFTRLNVLITSLVMIVLVIITRRPEKIKFGNVLDSQNLFVKLEPNQTPQSSPNLPTKRNILFFCHLDSKGQKLTILSRVFAIRTWIFSMIVSIIAIILKNAFLIQEINLLYILGLIPILSNLFATILIIYNRTDNSSPGAIDNASGIACVLELLNYYYNLENRFNDHNMWFVFTGAEETGTMGIRNLLSMFNHFDKETSVGINFDAIGQSVSLFAGINSRRKASRFVKIFELNGKNKKVVNEFKKRVIGTHSDGCYLKKKGYRGVGYGDTSIYKFMHSINDTIDKVDISLLKRLCELTIESIKEYCLN